jgi:hypothetical protein
MNFLEFTVSSFQCVLTYEKAGDICFAVTEVVYNSYLFFRETTRSHIVIEAKGGGRGDYI